MRGAYLKLKPREPIYFADIWRLSLNHDGVEFLLTRETSRTGRRVIRRWRIYSGTQERVKPPKFLRLHGPGGSTVVERVIGHTHSRPIPYDPIFVQPSDADISSLSKLLNNWQQVYGERAEPFARIIWGLDPGDVTIYGMDSAPGNAVAPSWIRR